MTDLLTAIEAAISEDERAASGEARCWETGSRWENQPVRWVHHAQRWPTARVLRQAQAHRHILAEHPQLTASSDLFRDGSGGLGDCACCRYPWPCATVRHLADGYGIEVT